MLKIKYFSLILGDRVVTLRESKIREKYLRFSALGTRSRFAYREVGEGREQERKLLYLPGKIRFTSKKLDCQSAADEYD